MEFDKRIKKLESDIHLISSIRDILMSSNGSSEDTGNNGEKGSRGQSLVEVEFPVRDSGGGDAVQNQASMKHASCAKTASAKINIARVGRNSCKKGMIENANNENIAQTKNLEQIEKLQEEISTEIRNRLDAEESAKIVAIQLQKVEDDLRREKDVKKSLLEGTLQMKNQLQSYYSEISVLEKRVTDLQSENAKLASSLKSLEDGKLQEVTAYQTQINLLELERTKLINQRHKLDKELEVLTVRNSELKTKFLETQEAFTTQDNQIRLQLTTSVEKISIVCDQKRKIEQELELALNRIEILQEKLKSSHFKIKTQQQDYCVKLKEKEEQIKSVNTALYRERENLSQKIDAATALVSRTKSFILGLQNEKQAKENLVQKYVLDIRQLQQEKTEWVKTVHELKKRTEHQDDFRERFWSLNQNCVKETRQLEHERDELKLLLKHESHKVLDVTKNQELLHESLANAKKKCEEEKICGESVAQNLRDQLKRVSDNLQILQKISEDQGKTITKQRNELETNSELRYKLELQLRESGETEKALITRLRDEENSNKELELQISHFENQLSLLNKEVKHHDCEEFVESKFLGKVKELERKVLGLEREIKSKEQECGKALAAARKGVLQATNLKDSFELKIVNMKTSYSNEIVKIRQENQQQEAERNKKICDLESEVMRMRESSRQMQNAYLGKIQQLQNALSVCCAGVGTGIGGGMSTQQGFNFGFPHQSSCAANFNVGVPPFF